MGTPEDPKAKAPPHPKVLEYLQRFNAGEDLRNMREGMPPAMAHDFEGLLTQQREEARNQRVAAEQAQARDSVASMNPGELQTFVVQNVPAQYVGMSRKALEFIWAEEGNVALSIDDPRQKRRKTEIARRAQVIAALGVLEEGRGQAGIRGREAENQVAIKELHVKLGIAVPGESVEQTFDGFQDLKSSDLNQGLAHREKSLQRGLLVTSDNTEHGQDAFAIEGDSFALSDGASSYGRSGVVSRLVSEELVTLSNKNMSFDDIFRESRMRKMLARVAQSPEFKNLGSSEASNSPSNKNAGLCTILLARLDKQNRRIEYASIGDSPLVVLDREADGTISFEIVNDDIQGKKINGQTFTDEDVLNDIRNPETHLIGIGKNGELRVEDLQVLRRGHVEYKSGRVVMLASDFLTKMMVVSPQMISKNTERARAAGKERVAAALEDIQKATASAQNIFAQNAFRPELFADPSIPKPQYLQQLKDWKRIPAHNAACDDMTLISIEMDKAI